MHEHTVRMRNWAVSAGRGIERSTSIDVVLAGMARVGPQGNGMGCCRHASLIGSSRALRIL